ncbi:MAG: D-glycerate dehydrogenase [Gemmatimonadetes bacterium]|nr:D-glycerate dehydrogenase [Gemmatimonadota bacterium]
MTRPAVVVTRRLPDTVESALAEQFDVRLNGDDHPMSPGELRAALREADALLCTVTDSLTVGVFDIESCRARIVANFGVGYNHIDMEAARRLGLVVTNTPDVLTDDTADLSIGLMLAVARRMGEGERQLRAGDWTGWRPTHLMGTRVTGKTLGIVGFGRIGQAVAHRARSGFGMSVLFASRGPVADEVVAGAAAGAEQRPLDALLAEADFVSLHVPATPETYHLIDARRLRMMRRNAFLINTARGDVVDEVALIDALQAGTIAGAGLDVYQQEPSVPKALMALTNVVLLPHLGSATMESRTAMGMRAVENLVAFFEGREPPDVVAVVDSGAG